MNLEKKEVYGSSTSDSADKEAWKHQSQVDKELEKGGSVVLTISIISLLVLATLIVVIFVNSNRSASSKVILDDANSYCPTVNNVENDWCYLNLAKTRKADYCNNIHNPDLKSYCRSIIKNDKTFCQDIDNLLVKDACFISLAVENKDKSFCLSTTKRVYCEKQVDEASAAK
jgi:hypothetical protein